MDIARAMHIYATVTGATWSQLSQLHRQALRAVLLEHRKEQDKRLAAALESVRGHTLAGDHVNRAVTKVAKEFGVSDLRAKNQHEGAKR